MLRGARRWPSIGAGAAPPPSHASARFCRCGRPSRPGSAIAPCHENPTANAAVVLSLHALGLVPRVEGRATEASPRLHRLTRAVVGSALCSTQPTPHHLT